MNQLRLLCKPSGASGGKITPQKRFTLAVEGDAIMRHTFRLPHHAMQYLLFNSFTDTSHVICTSVAPACSQRHPLEAGRRMR